MPSVGPGAAPINVDSVNVDGSTPEEQHAWMSSLVGATEAARLLGVTKPTLYAYVSRGVVSRRTSPDGRTSLYDRNELERLIDRTRRRGPSQRPTIDVEVASAITELTDESLRYRGRSAAELARTTTFEQVAELLWSGELPVTATRWPVDTRALARCRDVVAASDVTDPLVHLALAATALSDDPEAGAPATARRLLAIAPSVLGGTRRGTIAERLATAFVRRPEPELVDAISCALVLLADHELATSTLAVRVACSVRAGPSAAFATGLHVLRGPLHGAASQLVAVLLERADRIGARDATREILAAGERLPGFGHTVYRNGDPRLSPLLEAIRSIPGGGRRCAVVDAVVTEAGRAVPKLPNVDLGLGALLYVAGLPLDAPIFAVARVAGWAAHYDEERAERPVRYRGITRRS